MQPASATDAANIKRRLRGRPRQQRPKNLLSLPLDPEVVARFRATGPVWQSRTNEVLREHLPEVSEALRAGHNVWHKNKFSHVRLAILT